MKLVACTLALLLAASVAFGEPPPGTDLGSRTHAWWECHKQPVNGISCCSEADGHSLKDTDWGSDGNHYKIRVEGVWFPVPENTILMGDTCGADPREDAQSEAKVWYRTIRNLSNRIEMLYVLCFQPGTQY